MKEALLLLPVLVVTVSLLIRAEFAGDRWQIYLLKPLSTLLVILMALLSLAQPAWERTYTLGVLLGLAFSLVGDVALMFQEKKRAFLLGLVFFLLAQVVYALVFWRLGVPSGKDWLITAVLLAVGAYFYHRMLPCLGPMKVPVIVYMLAISLMVHQAFTLVNSPLFVPLQAWMVVSGALLFYISDMILAYNRYCQPWKYHRISLAFYYSGQALIALAASYFR